MPENDPNRTVPRTPSAPDQATNHTPAADTSARAADESAADSKRTAARPTVEGTVARTPSDVARLEEAAQAHSAEGVPGYVLLGKLGEGGMGIVHKARHVKLNRIVALKMMVGGENATRGDLLRFLAEAEAVAAVRHDNVVQVYDYGENDGRPFMALEFCPGGTLGKMLPKGRDAANAPREMAALIAQVARGVAAAHAKGIIHRDLKPGNVFLDESGVPKVADFGLAKRGEGSDVTQAGVGMGTPSYVAPEQARDAKFVGPQADVWALGVILYEALTGTRPFTGTVQEILAKAQNAEPVAPRKVAAVVPRDLELICLHCLAKAPHERYPTAKELADDLDRYARGEPISVRPAGPIERAYKWVKRNKVVSGATAAVFLALSVGLGFSIGFGLEMQKKKKAAEVALARGVLSSLVTNSRGQDWLTEYEQGSLWLLTEHRGTPVPQVFLTEATRTRLGCVQLANRAEFAMHAAVGLDPVARADAERHLLERLNDPTLSAEMRTRLVVVCLQVKPGSELTKSAPALAEQVAPDAGFAGPSRTETALLALVPRLGPAEAKAIAERLTAAMTKTTNAEAVAALVRCLVAVAGRLSRADAADAVALAIEPLTAQLLKPGSGFGSPHPAALLFGRVAEHLDPAETARVAREFADALTAKKKPGQFDPAEGQAQTIAAMASHLQPADAADLAAALIRVIGSRSNSALRQPVLAALTALAPRLDPATVPAIVQNLTVVLNLTAILDPQERSAPDAVKCLAALLARSSVAGAVAAHLTALEAAKTGRDLVGPAQSLGALADQLDPPLAARVADALVGAMPRATNPSALRAVVRSTVAVEPRLAPADAARVAAAFAAGLTKTNNEEALRTFALGVPAFAPHFAPETATGVSQSLAGAFSRTALKIALTGPPQRDGLTIEKSEMPDTPGPFALRDLAVAMVALTPRLDAGDGTCATAAGGLSAALKGTTNPHSLCEMAPVLLLLAPHAGPDPAGARAARLLLDAVAPLGVPPANGVGNSFKAFEARHLVIALGELAPVADPADVMRATPALVSALGQSLNEQIGDEIVWTLGMLATRIEPSARGPLLDAIAYFVVNTAARDRFESGLTPGNATRADTSRGVLAAVLLGRAPPTATRPRFGDRDNPPDAALPASLGGGLSPQALVELLKHPFYIRDARRAVLDALEFTYKQQFADQWEFVEYAQKHQSQLDLLTPPKRPQEP